VLTAEEQFHNSLTKIQNTYMDILVRVRDGSAFSFGAFSGNAYSIAYSCQCGTQNLTRRAGTVTDQHTT